MRLIDADELQSALKKMQKWVVVKDNYHNEGYSYDQVHFAIDNAPTVDAEPVRHGVWTGKPIGGYSTVRCSVCGHAFFYNNGKWKYCPNCGAKMDKEI